MQVASVHDQGVGDVVFAPNASFALWNVFTMFATHTRYMPSISELATIDSCQPTYASNTDIGSYLWQASFKLIPLLLNRYMIRFLVFPHLQQADDQSKARK